MNKRRIPSRIFCVLVYLFLYAPIALLIIFSFNSAKSNRVWEGFSLKWYLELFQDARLLGSLRTTLILSVLAALAIISWSVFLYRPQKARSLVLQLLPWCFLFIRMAVPLTQLPRP